MKIYKNPWVSRACYFVITGKASSAKMEASKSAGYVIDFWEGKWQVRKGTFYDCHIREMSVVAENRVSIKSVIEGAILSAVLDLVEDAEAHKEAVHNDLNGTD